MKDTIKKYLTPKTAVILALIAVAFFLPGVSSRRVQSIMCTVCIYAALGQSWNILSGLCGMFSVTHAIFYGVGVYAMLISISKFNQSPLVGVLVGLLLNLALALMVGKIGSKLSSLYFTMALIGVSSALYTLATQWSSLTNSIYGLSLGRAYAVPRQTMTYIGIAMVIVYALFFVFLRQSRVGTSLVALKNNPNLCMALGSNVGAWRIIATVISASMASLVGVYYGFYMTSVVPDIFGADISLKIIMVAIVGGVGSVWGPILGSSLIILDEWVRGVISPDYAALANVVYALVLIVMLLLRPNGLVSIKLPGLKAKAARTGAGAGA